MKLYAPIEAYTQALDVASIPEDRRETLDMIASELSSKIVDNQRLNINFVCTHNSRRSQLAQVWAQVFSAHLGLNIKNFSSGVAETALYRTAALALQDVGFDIMKTGENNPEYTLHFSGDASPIVCFSKTYDHPYIDTPYVAIMVCSDADENCPYLPDALARLPLRYEDPKAFDETEQELAKYLERSKQIATELKYMFEQIK